VILRAALPLETACLVGSSLRGWLRGPIMHQSTKLQHNRAMRG